MDSGRKGNERFWVCEVAGVLTDPDPELPGAPGIRKMAEHAAERVQYQELCHENSRGLPWLSCAETELLVQEARLAAGWYHWSPGEDQYSEAPHEALKSSSRLWGASLLGV